MQDSPSEISPEIRESLKYYCEITPRFEEKADENVGSTAEQAGSPKNRELLPDFELGKLSNLDIRGGTNRIVVILLITSKNSSYLFSYLYPGVLLNQNIFLLIFIKLNIFNIIKITVLRAQIFLYYKFEKRRKIVKSILYLILRNKIIILLIQFQ